VGDALIHLGHQNESRNDEDSPTHPEHAREKSGGNTNENNGAG
jgi:hypothetical protein